MPRFAAACAASPSSIRPPADSRRPRPPPPHGVLAPSPRRRGEPPGGLCQKERLREVVLCWLSDDVAIYHSDAGAMTALPTRLTSRASARTAAWSQKRPSLAVSYLGSCASSKRAYIVAHGVRLGALRVRDGRPERQTVASDASSYLTASDKQDVPQVNLKVERAHVCRAVGKRTACLANAERNRSKRSPRVQSPAGISIGSVYQPRTHRSLFISFP